MLLFLHFNYAICCFEKVSCSLFVIRAKFKAKEGGRCNLFISIGSDIIFELAVNIIILRPNTLSYVCLATSGIPISLSDLSDPCEIINYTCPSSNHSLPFHHAHAHTLTHACIHMHMQRTHTHTEAFGAALYSSWTGLFVQTRLTQLQMSRIKAISPFIPPHLRTSNSCTN